ncbi:MAG: UDP-N-acetylmuramate dehydrogenase [Oscillospiraceae bacterium]|nr:UDP-N-acetylmuramate dehydrogenase [Oscillospiraceae bacterium]
MDDISQAIEIVSHKLPKTQFRTNEPMRHHTSFKIGGPAKVMFFPEKADEAADLCRLLQECGVVPLVLGNGTNLLVSDEPLRHAVVNTSRLANLVHSGELEITADAGVMLARLAVFACERGLAGLEFAHGIPGSLGGAVLMNAGAYGGEMKDVVYSTAACSFVSGVFDVSGEEHGFGYRCSRFSENGEIVLSSVIRLRRGDADDIRGEMEELGVRRRNSQPLDMPSAGSVFKRPKDGYAGFMIEQAGLKGYMSGGAQVSEKHAGFIVNRGGASFLDVMRVIDHVRAAVLKQFGVELELEIKIVRGDM